MNFLALVIIAEFDDYFFKTVATEMLGNLLREKEMWIYNYDINISSHLLRRVTTIENALEKLEEE